MNKSSIILGNPSFSAKSVKELPFVSVYDSGFRFEEVGFSAGFGETREERTEVFTGDGKTVTFKFPEIPLRPIARVESPKNYFRKEGSDFSVDYSKASLTFRSPPPKGKNNVLITYTIAKTAAQIKGLRLEIECNVDLWAKNAVDCDGLALDAMKALLVSAEELENKGINLRPSKGFSIVEDGRSSDDRDGNMKANKTESTSKGKSDAKDTRPAIETYGKRLVYVAETNVKAEVKIPRIEKIQIKGEK